VRQSRIEASSDSTERARFARWRGKLAFASAVGVVAALAWLALFLSYERPWALRGDNKLTFLPLGAEVYRQWTEGHLPQWSNGHWGGVPLLADPQAASFYLPNLVAFWLTPPPHLRALDLLIALHLGLFAAGTAYLLLELGASRRGALFGAALASLSPHLLWWTSFLPTIEALAWWPWLFAAAERLATTDGGEGRALTLGSVAWAAQVLSGYGEFAFYSGCVAAVWILASSSAVSLPTRLRRCCLLGLLGVLLAGPQLVPTLLELPDTQRGGEPDHMAIFAVTIDGPRSLLDPRTGSRAIWSSPFLGAATLTLCACAFLRPRRRPVLLAVMAVAAALPALGVRSPVYGLLVTLPGFKLFRGPAKLYLITQFAVLWLAALGFARLLARRTGRAAVAAAVLGFLALAEYLVHATFQLPRLPLAHTNVEAVIPESLDWLASQIETLAPADQQRGPPPRTYWARSWGSYGSLGMLLGMESLNGGQVSIINRRVQPLPVLDRRSQFDALGVDLVVLPARCPLPGGSGLESVAHWFDRLCLLRNPGRPPRYALLANWESVASEEEMMQWIVGGGGDSIPILASPSELPARPVAAEFPGSVDVLDYRPGNVRLDVSATVPALLLVRESWSRGWTAFVDGAQVPIHPAAAIYYALAVPRGRHVVELRYATPGLYLGLAGFVAWCCLTAWNLRRSVFSSGGNAVVSGPAALRCGSQSH